MNKKLVLSLVGLGVAGFLATVAYINHFDNQQKEKLLAQSAVKDPAAKLVERVLYDNQCQYCHSPNAEVPFYINLPVINSVMQNDINKALDHFLLSEIVDHLDNPQQISATALAKLERVVINDEMPTKSFVHLHWGSSLNAEEQKVLLDWIRQQRKDHLLPSNTQGVSADRFIQPIPDSLKTDPAKVALGNLLFHSTALSGDDTVSCASCHGLNSGGVDNLATSTGIHGQKGGINAPTVYNAAFNFVQFWDGRAATLADQAGGPPFNPVEMGSKDWAEIIAKLEQDTELKSAFLQVYPDGFSGDNITNAIAEFEKTLITPNSPFDRYLKGDASALTASQQHGYALFQQYKCDTCHSGINMGGNSYELMGTKANYFADRGTPLTADDNGRFSQTQDPRDKHRFKVPSLRNIALTGPYFHDAKAENLQQAVEMMLKYQSGVTLPQQDVSDMVDFLHSLTGELNGKTLVNEKVNEKQ
ncbi:cytochrome-c peroxidase [Testudinibacter sp. TR-2022]|uniref:cytochrome-c peroxidase n=1 Tax=Testudinibacter sp. TR-2022 TaxID=2585029 RepID=UPI00111B6598|nr:cytochrome-c peroxidase [Testudinibacter sp. TR-2022]TNH02424.1 cytochrome-c peroxidase [Pasteurellaceae bacterium Phil31]TNH06035.1 cytochrome-c peroxidase [Testudinibacter sp. TR-2022]TNH07301.1 cytochrome-c peroxidase [Testudinibacter sp. TR-2022]TNH13375.1 cytochrome-c peroxidase [Testudinibacter sp. TR-2022]TNH13984.1 cytochrome-c peroxidase [Testudinibacter sp. TR-2022]